MSDPVFKIRQSKDREQPENPAWVAALAAVLLSAAENRRERDDSPESLRVVSGKGGEE